MRIHRRTETTIKLTEVEFMEALGLNGEGNITAIEKKYEENFPRYGSHTNMIEIKVLRHELRKRKPWRRK